MTSPVARSTGKRLGRYHLAEPLGGGPTGEVFRAKVYGVAGFERQFAVKRFHPEFVKDPDTAADIATATRTYGSLEHPRIARLHEYGVTGGETFTATEFIYGMDLAQLSSGGPSRGRTIPPGAWAALISQAARTVGYAHGRGIGHLGLCPTNLIATPEGEAKITDFCLLPARLPSRPGTDASLRVRLPYLAPEQIAGEATSAATDVFQLGAIAYELIAGRAAFTGPSSQDIAHKILTGLPPSANLPGAIVSVLMRCLARSPAERYPDARALADALDAALRSAPLPGSTNDVGRAVREALHQLSEIRDEQVSGAVSFPMPAPPASRPAARQPAPTPGAAPAKPPPAAPPASRPAARQPAPTPPARKSEPLLPPHVGHTLPNPEGGPPIKMPHISGDVAPGDLVDEEMPTRVRERAKGFVSVPGATRGRPGSAPLGPAPMRRAGTPAPLPGTPRSVAPAATAAGQPPMQPGRTPGALPRPGNAPGVPAGAAPGAPAGARQAAGVPASGGPRARTAPPAAFPPGAPASTAPATTAAMHASAPAPSQRGAQPPNQTGEAQHHLATPPEFLKTLHTLEPRGLPAGATASRVEPPGQEPGAGAGAYTRKSRRRRGLLVALGVAAAGLIGVTAVVVYSQVLSKQSDAGAATASDAGAGTRPATTNTGALAAQGPVDAALAPPLDARAAEPVEEDAAAAQVAVVADKLIIRSEPSGAKVYLDGSLQGKTPETIDGTSDRYRLALVLPDYKLHLAEIAGSGIVDVTLQEVTPSEGKGGIKVRCNRKNRYYVFLNGVDTGQLCPSERLGVDLDSHVLEIYDPVTESRREFRVDVEDTSRSVRIRVD